MAGNNKAVVINKKGCTLCGACVAVCPAKCIFLKEDEYGFTYPYIDKSRCLNCGLCNSVCHLNKNNFEKKSEDVYAAWSLNDKTRENSASGGLASEIYNYCLKNKIHCFGVAFDVENGAFYKEIRNVSDIKECQNSKYVESNMGNIFTTIKNYLKSDDKVVFVGLGCQVSALISFVGGKKDNLITIDIVCHGVTPFKYLKEHIKYVENKTKHKTEQVCFRDPEYDTNSFNLTFRENNKVFYKKPAHYDDNYQCGYHSALTYRENCYNCHYARDTRVSDLTISDFSGLGSYAEWNKGEKSISRLIINTEKGQNLINELICENRLFCEKRPIEEAYMCEDMFRHPSIAHKNRKLFLDLYKNGNGFEYSANLALKKDIKKNKIRKYMYPFKMLRVKLGLMKKKLYNIFK